MITAFGYTEVGFLDTIVLKFQLLEEAPLLSIRVAPIYIPIQMHEFPFCYIHTNSFVFNSQNVLVGVEWYRSVSLMCTSCVICATENTYVLLVMSVYFLPLLLSCMSRLSF